MAQIISILDVTTDVIVCIGFYREERTEFFACSLVIILLAFIAYDIAFVWRFGHGVDTEQICLWVCLLPFSPLLPFVFFFTHSSDTWLAKYIERHSCGFNIQFEAKSASSDGSALRKFMEEKIAKHFGFIIEALVEGVTDKLAHPKLNNV